MAELKPMFPPGLNAEVALDNTLFVTASLEEAVMTLVEAILLVILVIFIFYRIGAPLSFQPSPSPSP
ncbi:efflux RND transporter permease subunit [Synechocystis sp. B12]|nr:efflux RND transporter permease subunit [Synechocystis sp. B12]